MKLHIFVEEDKNKTNRKAKGAKTNKPKQPKAPKPTPDKQKARRTYWAIRKAQEKKAANVGGENNENKE